MTMSVKNGGVWSEITPSVKVSGVWQTLVEGYVKVAGVWQQFYDSFVVQLFGQSFTYFGGTPAEYHLNSDGNVYRRTSSSLTNRGAWISDASQVGAYEARVTITSGSFQVGSDPSGTWLPLSTTRTWSRGAAGGASQTVAFTVEIRRASDSVVMATALINMTCDRT